MDESSAIGGTTGFEPSCVPGGEHVQYAVILGGHEGVQALVHPVQQSRSLGLSLEPALVPSQISGLPAQGPRHMRAGAHHCLDSGTPGAKLPRVSKIGSS